MRITSALPLLLVSSLAAIGCNPSESTGESGDNTAPLETFQQVYFQQLYGTHIASGPDGDVFLGGTFQDTIDFGGGDLTAPATGTLFFAHLDEAGKHIMSGSTGAYDNVGDVAVGSEGACFAAGSFEGSANFGTGKMIANHAGYLASFNDDGTTAFARSFPNSYQTEISSVAPLPNSGVVIAARTDDTVDFGMNDVNTTTWAINSMVAAYDKSGNLKWQIRIDANLMGTPRIATDKDGNVYVAGSTYEGFNLGGTEVQGYSLFVAKISPKGAPLWIQTSKNDQEFGSPPTVEDVSVDDEGDVYVAGNYYYYPFSIAGVDSSPTQSFNVYLLKLNGSGAGQYLKDFPVDASYARVTVAAANDGEALLGVTALFAIDFGGGGVGTNNNMTGYVARFDAKGNHMKSMALGADLDDYLDDLAADKDGNPVIFGRFSYKIELNGEQLMDDGTAASYLARIKL